MKLLFALRVAVTALTVELVHCQLRASGSKRMTKEMSSSSPVTPQESLTSHSDTTSFTREPSTPPSRFPTFMARNSERSLANGSTWDATTAPTSTPATTHTPTTSSTNNGSTEHYVCPSVQFDLCGDDDDHAHFECCTIVHISNEENSQRVNYMVQYKRRDAVQQTLDGRRQISRTYYAKSLNVVFTDPTGNLICEVDRGMPPNFC